MIFIDLINGKPTIDWERFDKDRVRKPYISHHFRFTHTAIASLDGTPDEKLQQLEKLLRDHDTVYDFAEKENKYCCRYQWQARSGYGVADSEQEAKTLAQVDILSILCDHPIDAYRQNDIWDEYDSWDE